MTTTLIVRQQFKLTICIAHSHTLGQAPWHRLSTITAFAQSVLPQTPEVGHAFLVTAVLKWLARENKSYAITATYTVFHFPPYADLMCTPCIVGAGGVNG